MPHDNIMHYRTQKSAGANRKPVLQRNQQVLFTNLLATLNVWPRKEEYNEKLFP